ncbi:hypothetical protein BU15DRAFT_67169 [Melanogaster broomeanus]|nr:hypothetical protein BU15DRAFT_67169 [Melanogaster broomeanus]
MIACPECPPSIQAKFIPALAVLHNFIRIYNPQDAGFPVNTTRPRQEHPTVVPANYGQDVGIVEQNRAAKQRDDIAQAMWESYQTVLREREEEGDKYLQGLE